MIKTTKKNIYIVHGYQASPNDHWFPWLSKRLNDAGHISKRVVLAESEQPNFEYWQKFLSLQMSRLDENTIIVAHSLGCLTTLHYLSTYFEVHKSKIKAGIFVAGFMSPLKAILELNDFIQKAKLNRLVLVKGMPLSVCLLSSNDPYVPPPLTLQLSNLIQAQNIEVKNAGHFMAQDGYIEFEQLWETLQPLLA